jgi:hypothetical protein
MPLAQAMRLLSGATFGQDAPDPDWSAISAGPWLAERAACAILLPWPPSIPARCCMPSCVPISRRACAGCTF